MLLAAGTAAAEGLGSGRWVRSKEALQALAARGFAAAPTGTAARAAGQPAAAPLTREPGPGLLGTIAWTGNGIPVCNVASLQGAPSVVSDNSGGAIVAWIDNRRLHYDIYAERLDGNGNPLWPAAGVVLAANDSLLISPLAMPDGSSGAFVIIGQVTQGGLFSNILVQRVTSAGTIAPGWPANGLGVAPGGASGFGAVPTNDGFLLMGWTDLDGQIRLVCITGAGGYAAGWNAAGLAVSHPQSDNIISPAPDGAGGAYVCWALSDSVMLTRVTAVGGFAPGWTAAGTVVSSGLSLPGAGVAAALLTGGDAMVFWPDLRSFTDPDIYAMRYTSAGLPGAGWPANGALAVGGTDIQVYPDAVPDGAGGALVICTVGASDSIVAQRMTGSGAVSFGWPAEGVALGKHPGKYLSGPISDGASGAIIAWSAAKATGDGVFAQRVGAGGTLFGAWPSGPGAVSDAIGDQSFPAIATDGNSGMIAAWEDSRDGGSRVYAARVLFDGTVGTLAALVSASAEPGRARLHWYTEDGAFEAGLERASGDGAFVEIARVRAEAGHVRYEDRDVVAGRTYHYRLAVADGGATSYLGAVTLRVPEGLNLALAGFAPNPAVGALRLAYALPTGEPARIEVLDPAGRRVLERDLDSSPGEHVVSFTAGALESGVYILRLTQGSRSVTARAAVIR